MSSRWTERTSTRGLAAAGLALNLALAACASAPEEAGKPVYYRCADGARFSVTPVDSTRVELARGGNRYTLTQVEAASGAKYSSSKASFWNKGEESLIEVGDKRYLECKLDNVQSSDAAVNQLQKLFGKSLGTGGGTR
jgi:membrane-bound inhibitor of C-type lysozyme